MITIKEKYEVIKKEGRLSFVYTVVGDMYLLWNDNEIIAGFSTEDRGKFAMGNIAELLEQVTKKQRRYCAESGFDIETGKYTFEAIQTARSPLNEDSHE